VESPSSSPPPPGACAARVETAELGASVVESPSSSPPPPLPFPFPFPFPVSAELGASVVESPSSSPPPPGACAARSLICFSAIAAATVGPASTNSASESCPSPSWSKRRQFSFPGSKPMACSTTDISVPLRSPERSLSKPRKILRSSLILNW